MRKMAEHEPHLSQAELARRTGVGQATISRWIYKPGRPNSDKLQLLASTLEVSYGELLTIAGYGEPAEDITQALSDLRPTGDPLGDELSEMLAADSPLSDDDRSLLREMVSRCMEPAREVMRRRRPA